MSLWVRRRSLSRFRFPRKRHIYFWRDYLLWQRLWDAMFEDVPLPGLSPLGAETAAAGTWADPEGPGRCRRCRSWLESASTYVWQVRAREDVDLAAELFLCGDCTRAVLAAWRPRGG